MTDIKLGLIGGGYWGKNLIREFNNCGILDTICEINLDAIKEYNQTYPDIKTTTNWQDIIKSSTINAVCISLPAELHYKFAKEALENGKDVYVEKPITLNVIEAEELVSIAKDNNLILMVGHLLHYHPCIIKIKELITSGKLGKVKNITSNRFNLGKFRSQENVLWSFAPHDISVILSLCGNKLPTMCECTGVDHLQKGIHDVTNSILMVDGVYVNINVNWLNPFKEQKMTIICEKGMIVFDDTKKENKLELFKDYISWDSLGTTPTPVKNNCINLEYENISPLYNECLHFMNFCKTRTMPITDGEEGVRVLKVLNNLHSKLILKFDSLHQNTTMDMSQYEKTKLNILVTCVGSAPSKAVVAALKKSKKYNFNIVGIDMNTICAGTFLCDKFMQFPSFKDNNYKNKIYELIEDNNIQFIIPTYSKELLFWAKFKIELENKYINLKVVSNNLDIIDIANNKNNTINFCKKNNIRYPYKYNIGDITSDFTDYPIILKPFEGSGATGIVICNNYEDYKNNIKNIDINKYLLQKFIKGTEYTCDVISNLNSNIISVIPKKRVRIEKGAAIESITIYNKKVIEYVKDVSEKIGNKFTMNIQVIQDSITGDIYMVEINPRFATSLPLSVESGINIPEILIDNYFNKDHVRLEFKNNLTMYRHYTEYFL